PLLPAPCGDGRGVGLENHDYFTGGASLPSLGGVGRPPPLPLAGRSEDGVSRPPPSDTSPSPLRGGPGRGSREPGLLVEGVGTVGRQVGDWVGGLAVVAVLEVEVRPGGVAGRALEADDLTLVYSVTDLHLVDEQVSVQREEVVAVGDDHVSAVADQLAVEHAGVGGHHRAVI